MLTRNRGQWRSAYRNFVSKEEPDEINKLFERKRTPSLLGSESFMEWVRERFFHQKLHKEVPDSKILAPDMEAITQVVAKAYRVPPSNLLRSKRGFFNEPRNVSIYLARTLRGETLEAICNEFDLSRHSSASSVIERMKAQMESDRKLRRRVHRIKAKLTRRR
jgi:chromosomal replication initiation ATPase DnaA